MSKKFLLGIIVGLFLLPAYADEGKCDKQSLNSSTTVCVTEQCIFEHQHLHLAGFGTSPSNA